MTLNAAGTGAAVQVSMASPPKHIFRLGDRVATVGPMNVTNSVTIGGVRLYRPRLDSEYAFRLEVAEFLAKSHFEGEHRTVKSIKHVLTSMLIFFTEEFSQCVQLLGSRHLTEFIFTTHDAWGQAMKALKAGSLSAPEKEAYHRYGPTARRLLEYIIERVVVLKPEEAPAAPEPDLLWLLDRLMIAGEWMLSLASKYAQVTRLFPDNSLLRISPQSTDYIVELEVHGDIGRRYDDFGTVAREFMYTRAFGWDHLPQLLEELDAPFRADHGVGICDAFALIKNAIEDARPAPEGFAVVFVQVEKVVEAMSSASGLTQSQVRTILSPWILTHDGLVSEDRVVWKPRQRNRLARRPLAMMPHETGPHVCFSKPFANAAASFVFGDLLYSNIAPEWKTDTIQRMLDRSVRVIDHEWEDHVHKELKERNLPGVRNIKVILDESAARHRVPDGVGEIDLLLVDPATGDLVIGEVKRVRPATWPPDFAEDKSKFVDGEDSYVAKFRRKLAWIEDNRMRVLAHLRTLKQLPAAFTDSGRSCAVIITDAECVAQVFCDDIVIISLQRLLRRHEVSGQWAFSGPR